MTNEEILKHIRNVPEFPKKGIIFKDITRTSLQQRLDEQNMRE